MPDSVQSLERLVEVGDDIVDVLRADGEADGRRRDAGGEELLDQGIKPNTIRLSIGTEHIDDIIADLEKGFAALG